jgi:hypothetical protein
MRIVVEIPEPHGRTERHARGYVVSALAAVDDTRTPHDARVYWGERVKSFDRVYAAVAKPPSNVQLVKHCQSALNIDPLSASKIDPLLWLVPVVHRGDPRDAECPSRG